MRVLAVAVLLWSAAVAAAVPSHPEIFVQTGHGFGIHAVAYSRDGKLIATAGLKNTVVVETEDAILICPRDRTQDVKKITALLKSKKLKMHLT